MKKIYKIATLTLLAAVTAAPSAMSQDALRSGYFLEGYYSRHELNPAFAPENNYFSLPALGGFYESLSSNVGVNSFLYPVTINGEEKLTTFMNPDIDAKESLGKFKKNNNISERFHLPIVNVGFRGLGGYNTLSLSVNAEANACLPKELFSFMKLGMTSDNTYYNFSNLGVDASAYATVALGHSHQILPQLRIGAKLKFMLGVADIHGRIDNFEARLSNNQWSLRAKGLLDVAAGPGLGMYPKRFYHPNCPEHERDLVDWDNIEYNSFGFSGFGMAMDLGAVYQLTPDLQLSASLLDLGFMSWNKVHKAATKQTEWTFDGFKDVALDSSQPDYEDKKLGQQLEDLGDQLEDCFDFHMVDENGSRSSGLGATMMIGAEYTMPFYRGLSGGVLFTQHIDGKYSWTEGRFSANVRPVNFFDASFNVGFSSYGTSVGALINFHPNGFNLFVGADYIATKYTPQFVPVGRANLQLSFGINFNFGAKKRSNMRPRLNSNFHVI